MRSTVEQLRAKNRFVDKSVYMIGLHLRTTRGVPVAVYTMPKVGSSAMAQTIRGEVGRPVIHCHRVSRPGLAAGSRHQEEYGVRRVPHSWNGEYLRYLLALRPRRRWDVVCGVRDPVAQAASGVFQSGEMFGHFDSSTTADADFVERMVRLVTKRLRRDHQGPLHWFSEELGAVTGLDVYSKPFDPSAGFQIYEYGRFRVLLVRFEDLPRVGGRALGTFFSAPDPSLQSRNAASKKSYAELYRQFKASAVFPASVLDAAYESQLAEHFYTPEETARFRARWSSRTLSPADRER